MLCSRPCSALSGWGFVCLFVRFSCVSGACFHAGMLCFEATSVLSALAGSRIEEPGSGEPRLCSCPHTTPKPRLCPHFKGRGQQPSLPFPSPQAVGCGLFSPRDTRHARHRSQPALSSLAARRKRARSQGSAAPPAQLLQGPLEGTCCVAFCGAVTPGCCSRRGATPEIVLRRFRVMEATQQECSSSGSLSGAVSRERSQRARRSCVGQEGAH